MKTVAAYLAKVEALSVEKVSVAAITDTKETVENLNRERLLEGRLADGSSLPNYSFTSVKVFGYPPGPWKLKNTGAFHIGINTEVTPGAFVTGSTDPKTQMLKRKVAAKGLDGESIFGLDKEGRIDYVKVLRPVFINGIQKALT